MTWTFEGERQVEKQVTSLSGTTATQVSSGSEFAYATRPNDTLLGWGLNHAGQLDHPSPSVWPGNVNNRESNRSLVETIPATYSQVDAGDLHACAVTVQGELECWGNNSHGQTNVPMRLLVRALDPQIPTPQYIKVSAGGEHTCALRDLGETNELLCWGSDAHGQSTVPSGDFIDVSAGGQHTCAVNSDNEVICWGKNSNGQTNEPSHGSYHSISAGGSHSCAINSTGGALCWGSNMKGQEYPPAGEYTQITSGSWHACALWTTDAPPLRGSPHVLGNQSPPGNVDCWGDNSGDKATPPAGVNFTQISAGGTFTCGIRAADSFIQCWGYGGAGSKRPHKMVSTVMETEDTKWSETHDISLPTTGRVLAKAYADGSLEFSFQVVRAGPDNDSFIEVFRRFVPNDGSLTVGRWYYSDMLSFVEVVQPPEGALETDPAEVQCDVGRIAIRLLPTGHIELALMQDDGELHIIPGNHNRLPTPAEIGVWWRTDQIRFAS